MSGYPMSDEAIRRSFAEIDHIQAETRKFAAGQLKLAAEEAKLVRERDIMPILAMISGMAAGGALVGGTVALTRRRSMRG